VTWIYILLSSVLEGITEFLPISSTGHLIILNHLLDIPDSDTLSSYNIFIQLGAILAVIRLYIADIVKDKSQIANIFLAFLPTAIIGVVFYPLIKTFFFDNIHVTITALIAGGIVILFLPPPKTSHKTLKPLDYIIIGIIQSLSIIPGTSRALSAILGGVVVGMSHVQAVRFSFLLAIPTIFGATIYDLYHNYSTIISSSLIPQFMVGSFISFIVAYFTLKFCITYIQDHGLKVFGYYRIVLGLVLALIFFV
jgi:undecaprenyl-diphosphatase